MIKAKRLISSIAALLFSSTMLITTSTLGTTVFAASTDSIRYEAEASVLPTGSNMLIKSESGTSSGKYISFTELIGEQRNSIAVFPKALDVKKPGVYKIALRYKTVNGDYKKQIVKAIQPMDTYEVDTVNKVLKNEKVVKEQKVEFQSKVWTDKETTFSFDSAGVYDLEVQGDWAYMDLDYIEVYKEPVVVNPEVDFIHFNFYKTNPEDLTFKYDNHYNQFVGLVADGANMDNSLYTVNEVAKSITIKKEFFLNNTAASGTIALHFDAGIDPQFTYNILNKAERKNVYQIEDATILGGSLLLTDTSAQGKFLQMKNGGGAAFALDVPAAGRYELHFVYRAPFGDKAQSVVVKNKTGELTYGVGFPMTSNNQWADVKQVVQLDAGFNTVTIRKLDGWMDVDYLRIGAAGASVVAPVVESAIISPTRDVFYFSAPRDMNIHLERNGHTVKDVTTEAGAKIEYKVENYTATELDNGQAENRRSIILVKEGLSNLPVGENKLTIKFEDGSAAVYNLTIVRKDTPKELEIVNFEVDHGNSTLVKLPNGKNLLIDSAKPEQADRVVLPYLKNNNLKVDYYILTHMHDDHNGRLADILKDNNLLRLSSTEAASLMALDKMARFEKLKGFQYLDNSMVLPKDELSNIWDLGGVKITVLNSRYDASGVKQSDQDENNTSMSMMLEYKGFKYSHGADNYAKTQDGIMNTFKDNLDFLKADYFFGNHHFHGSLSTDFIKLTDPKVVYVSANGAVYARGAYTTHYIEEVENYERVNGGSLQDTILSLESGSVVIKVNSKDDWTYETHKDINENVKIADTVKPEIKGAGSINVQKGSKFDALAGVTAIDNFDGDITSAVKVVGTVDTEKPGVYTLTYIVQDFSGNKSEITRQVTVSSLPKTGTFFDFLTMMSVGLAIICLGGIMVSAGIRKRLQ